MERDGKAVVGVCQGKGIGFWLDMKSINRWPFICESVNCEGVAVMIFSVAEMHHMVRSCWKCKSHTDSAKVISSGVRRKFTCSHNFTPFQALIMLNRQTGRILSDWIVNTPDINFNSPRIERCLPSHSHRQSDLFYDFLVWKVIWPK